MVCHEQVKTAFKQREGILMSETRAGNLSIEQQLVDYIHSLQFDNLPVNVVNYCKLLIMDSIGVTFPGSNAPGCSAVNRLIKSWGSNTGASVLIYGYKTPPPLAAMVNSTMMHALDFDDTLDFSALHTFVSVLPAALAASESIGNISGKQFLTALVVGVDIICRISLAIQRPLSWIRTATCGAFGAAAAAAKILRLNRDQTANALGIVYSQCSGNAQGLIEGRLVKRMQPGFAASAGVTSAFLAKEGITGCSGFLHGKYGFYNLYENGEYVATPVTKDLGRHFSITDLSIKPYPSCRMTHSAIDAAIALLPLINGSLNNISSIEIHASKMVSEMVGKPFIPGDNPQVDAQFSIPYTISVALHRKDVCLDDFENKAIFDPEIKILSDKVIVIPDTDLPDKDILQVRLNIYMNDGRIYEKHIKAPLGNPLNPMGIDLCKEKFNKCIIASKLDFDISNIRELLDLIENMEVVEDIAELTKLAII